MVVGISNAAITVLLVTPRFTIIHLVSSSVATLRRMVVLLISRRTIG